MQTTIGQLVSELVDEYERIYRDHDLATVATSVTLEEILHANAARAGCDDDTLSIRKPR